MDDSDLMVIWALLLMVYHLFCFWFLVALNPKP